MPRCEHTDAETDSPVPAVEAHAQLLYHGDRQILANSLYFGVQAYFENSQR